MVYILYNPLSNNNRGMEAVNEVKNLFKNEETTSEDIRTIGNAAAYVANLEKDDIVVICGGDGTVSKFADQSQSVKISQKIYYCPSGSGNDFAHDVESAPKYLDKLIPLNKYLESLPIVTVKGEKHYFIDGIGFGIDGYCCQVGDDMRANSIEKINYTSIAIKGLLGKFRPCNAVVTVDGVEKKYRRVWLAPSMLGKYYGGGMMVAPQQDRLNSEKTLTSVVWSKSGKLRTLITFPKIFTGEHVKHTSIIDVRTGHDIKVVFSKPQALQIDGETIRDVTSYMVSYK